VSDICFNLALESDREIHILRFLTAEEVLTHVLRCEQDQLVSTLHVEERLVLDDELNLEDRMELLVGRTRNAPVLFVCEIVLGTRSLLIQEVLVRIGLKTPWAKELGELIEINRRDVQNAEVNSE
jgi:hypothetical protein